MILKDTVSEASAVLKENNITSHELDAQLILSDLIGVSREFLLLNTDIKISNIISKKYHDAIKRRINKEPVAYIIGKKEFWSQNFYVNSSTLVPRPETEILIYKLIEIFKGKKINILDIGTGSGCILLSILKELVFSKGIGIDISPKAIETATKNSINLNLNKRSKFRVLDLNKFISGKYDLIVSNPPYIPTKDIKNLDIGITNYEPLIALNGGIDGLDLLKKVIYKAFKLLKKNGILALEIGTNQYIRVSALLKKQGLREIGKEIDYKQNIRCIISTKL